MGSIEFERSQETVVSTPNLMACVNRPLVPEPMEKIPHDRGMVPPPGRGFLKLPITVKEAFPNPIPLKRETDHLSPRASNAKTQTVARKLINEGFFAHGLAHSITSLAATQTSGQTFAVINEEDIIETFSRSSGPGGQNVNKVSTRVTVVHRPTGITVSCEASRSQSENRRTAREWLAAKVAEASAARRQERLAAASKARRQHAKRSRSTKRQLVEGKRRRGETKKLRKAPDL